jgi:hypothetical protein
MDTWSRSWIAGISCPVRVGALGSNKFLARAKPLQSLLDPARWVVGNKEKSMLRLTWFIRSG